LRERIEAARRDLTTRSLATDYLFNTPREWLPLLESAMGDERLTDLVLQGADPASRGAADNILLWTAEDRDWRGALLAEVLRKRQTSRIESVTIPRLGFERVLRALGSEAPSREALLQWKMAQQTHFPGGTLENLAARMERDLSLRIRVQGAPEVQIGQLTETYGRMLDLVLITHKMGYHVKGDEILIGPLEDFFR
jgi:hypothetical protein